MDSRSVFLFLLSTVTACSGTVRRRCRTAAASCAGVYVHSWDTAKKTHGSSGKNTVRDERDP